MGKNLSKKILVSNNFVPRNYGHKNICLKNLDGKKSPKKLLVKGRFDKKFSNKN